MNLTISATHNGSIIATATIFNVMPGELAKTISELIDAIRTHLGLGIFDNITIKIS